MNENDVKQRVLQNEEDVVELAVSMRKLVDYIERAIQMVENLSENVEELRERVDELERALASKSNHHVFPAVASLRRIQ